MIWDSEPWKNELAETIRRIEENGKDLLRRDGEMGVTDVLVERDLISAAFITRKLWDSFKLSFQVELQSLTVYRYPLRKSNVFPDSTNWDSPEKFYDLDAGERVELGLRQVTNQLIHSYVLLTVVDDDIQSQGYKLAGFFCASDTARKRGLYFVPWHTYRYSLNRVTRDDVVFKRVIRNGTGGSIELRSAKELTNEELKRWEAEHGAEIEALTLQHREFLGG